MEYADFFFFGQVVQAKFKKKKREREGNICINSSPVNCIFSFKNYWNFGTAILTLKD